MAFELDPGADGPAGDLATECRCLAGADLGLAEPRRPVRGERAMDAAGDRVFRDPVPWREITADAIESAVPPCRHHHAATVEPGDRRQVRSQVPDRKSTRLNSSH